MSWHMLAVVVGRIGRGLLMAVEAATPEVAIRGTQAEGAEWFPAADAHILRGGGGAQGRYVRSYRPSLRPLSPLV